MRRVGKDYNYTNLAISKRALEVAESELQNLRNWLEAEKLNSPEIGQHIHDRLRLLSGLVEDRFYSMEALRRDSEQHQHSLVSSQGVKITDHACVRYLQRVMGVDLKELSDEIVSKESASVVNGLGSGRVTDGESVLIFKGKAIITIMTKEMVKRCRMKPIDDRRKVSRKKHHKRAKNRRYGG